MKFLHAIVTILTFGILFTACGSNQYGAPVATGADALEESNTSVDATTACTTTTAAADGTTAAVDNSNSVQSGTSAQEQASTVTEQAPYKLGRIKDEKVVEIGDSPYGIAIDSNGIMYAAKNRGEIVRITSDGKVSPFFKIDGTSEAESNTIWSVQVGPDGNIYAPATDRLYKITPEGKSSLLIQDPGVFPTGVTFDNAGNLYVTSGFKVFKYTKSLEKSVFIDMGPSLHTMVLLDLKFDKDNKNLYMSNYATQRFYKYPIKIDGSAGEQEIILDTPKLEKYLNGQKPSWYPKLQNAHPSWFSLDEAGNLFVSMEDIYSILKIGTDHSYTLYEIDQPFFNSTIALGNGGFDKASLYTTGFEDGFIHKLTFQQD